MSFEDWIFVSSVAIPFVFLLASLVLWSTREFHTSSAIIQIYLECPFDECDFDIAVEVKNSNDPSLPGEIAKNILKNHAKYRHNHS